MMRRLLVAAMALLVAAQVIRNSAVAAFAGDSPDTAAQIWPGHPSVEVSLGMTQIGRAARARKPVPPSVFRTMNDAALKAPLAPEPFLVRGVQAQSLGNGPLAIQAFSAAARKDPRSLPAHYFLADALFRSGDTKRGLSEIGILARLAPGGASSLAPYLGAYAKDPKNWPRLRELLASEPQLQEATLTALAGNPSNVDTVLALANGGQRGRGTWLPTMLNSLVAAGEYGKARQIWTVLGARNAPHDLIYDGRFSRADAPPPFNWMLMSSAVGLAERGPGGLHVIFYGNQDGLLARQLLLLPADGYGVTIKLAGNATDAHALTWSMRCDGSQVPVAAMRLDVASSRVWRFEVPKGCPAQWLELSGVSSDISRRSEATIRSIDLVAVPLGG